MQDIHYRFRYQACVLLACMLLATACSGPLVLGTIYNGASKRITKDVKTYAKFNKSQKETIDHRFAQYHQWHRSTQLPLYSDLLRDVVQQLNSKKEIPLAAVSQWVTHANKLSIALRRCNPLNDATDFLTTLTEEQTSQIKQKTADAHALKVQKYKSETAEARSARRHKEMLSAAKRAGLKFNSIQSDLLAKTLSQQVSLGGQRLYQWQRWTDQFNELLAHRNKADFSDSMNQHIYSLWTLTQTNYPNEWQSSTALWTNFLHKFLALQTVKQNQKLQKKTTNIANSLDTISAKDSATSVTARCFNGLGQ